MSQITRKPTVYVETTIPSYLTAWPKSNPIIAEHQRLTREWWANSRVRYNLYISEVVLAEISIGDPIAAKERMQAVAGLQELSLSDPVRHLTRDYLKLLQIPASAAPDAVHLALAVISGIEYLLTWNCKHLANPRVMRAITAENTRRGLFVPLIVTPEELLLMEAQP
jgi:hypothetical protein